MHGKDIYFTSEAVFDTDFVKGSSDGRLGADGRRI